MITQPRPQLAPGAEGPRWGAYFIGDITINQFPEELEARLYAWCNPEEANCAFSWYAPTHAADAFEYALEIGSCLSRGMLIYVYHTEETGPILTRSAYPDRAGLCFFSASDIVAAWRDFESRAVFDLDMRGRMKIAAAKVLQRAKSGPRIPTPRALTKGYIYLLNGGGYFKIGRTTDPDRRTRDLRIQLPFRASVVHTIRADDMELAELYFHTVFQRERANGEWFSLSDKQVDWFKSLGQWTREDLANK